MQPTHKRPLLILLSNSFAATNIIHSGLISILAVQYDVHLLSTMIRPADILVINRHFKIELKLVDTCLPVLPKWLTMMRRVEKAVFSNHFGIATQKIKSLQESRHRQFLMRSVIQITTWLRLNKLILCMVRNVIIFATSYSLRLRPLLSYHFHGVISSSPMDLRENFVVNFLRKHKVRSLATVISWDNLTSKGVINADHDYMLVWNESMKREFLQFYPIFNCKETNVTVCGIPRFDCYFEHDARISLETLRKLYGIPKEKKVILIATSSSRHFPNQLEVIDDIIKFARNAGNIHIIIRTHPGDVPTLYDALSNVAFITVWHPEGLHAHHKRSFYEWLPHMDFLRSLSEMLHLCHVCVQFASTIRLDAAACGKPVISIGYDGCRELPYHESVRRLYDYTHQLPVNELGIDTLVADKKELYKALRENLSDLHTGRQLEMIAPLIHFTKAESVNFTAQTIAAWLD